MTGSDFSPPRPASLALGSSGFAVLQAGAGRAHSLSAAGRRAVSGPGGPSLRARGPRRGRTRNQVCGAGWDGPPCCGPGAAGGSRRSGLRRRTRCRPAFVPATGPVDATFRVQRAISSQVLLGSDSDGGGAATFPPTFLAGRWVDLSTPHRQVTKKPTRGLDYGRGSTSQSARRLGRSSPRRHPVPIEPADRTCSGSTPSNRPHSASPSGGHQQRHRHGGLQQRRRRAGVAGVSRGDWAVRPTPTGGSPDPAVQLGAPQPKPARRRRLRRRRQERMRIRPCRTHAHLRQQLGPDRPDLWRQFGPSTKRPMPWPTAPSQARFGVHRSSCRQFFAGNRRNVHESLLGPVQTDQSEATRAAERPWSRPSAVSSAPSSRRRPLADRSAITSSHADKAPVLRNRGTARRDQRHSPSPSAYRTMPSRSWQLIDRRARPVGLAGPLGPNSLACQHVSVPPGPLREQLAGTSALRHCFAGLTASLLVRSPASKRAPADVRLGAGARGRPAFDACLSSREQTSRWRDCLILQRLQGGGENLDAAFFDFAHPR